MPFTSRRRGHQDVSTCGLSPAGTTGESLPSAAASSFRRIFSIFPADSATFFRAAGEIELVRSPSAGLQKVGEEIPRHPEGA
jgi:hypothetical protein